MMAQSIPHLKDFMRLKDKVILVIASTRGIGLAIVKACARKGSGKAAINYLTRLIAVHEAKHHIRCNAVLPGMTATEAVTQNLSASGGFGLATPLYGELAGKKMRR